MINHAMLNDGGFFVLLLFSLMPVRPLPPAPLKLKFLQTRPSEGIIMGTDGAIALVLLRLLEMKVYE